tara:strand:+ start:3019 stop:3387 length:369 start_codon:yes stop_codon:yes gene_type:complete
MHKILLTKLELTGLIAHGLEVNKPSQLSDVFRQGVAWAIAENNTELNKLNHKNHMLQNRIDELEAKVARLEARGIEDMQLVIENQSSLILDLHASLRAIKQSSVTMEEHCYTERERIRDMQA